MSMKMTRRVRACRGLQDTKMGVLLWAVIFCLGLSGTGLAWSKSRQIDDFHWENVDRIIAIGDIHGDYGQYIAALQAAGLVDTKGRWVGGDAHLVQTGDIPDRGTDTLKIIEHLDKLTKQAKRKGGRVHSLIGNHEAMNVYGDLRYVSAGEFKAFETRNSAALRDRYYGLYLQGLDAQDPGSSALLAENHRQEWDKTHPLGWLEHRQAWDPAWNPKAKYAKWVRDKPVVIQINGHLFLHGGISQEYANTPLVDISKRAWMELAKFDPSQPRLIEDELGPLWYRGLSGVEPRATAETVEAILEFHGASGIVVGHTPTSGIIWPSYGARVIQVDTGISAHYGGHVAYLEITAGGLQAGYPDYTLAIPASDDARIQYLEAVMEHDPDNPHLKKRLELLLAPPPEPVPEISVDAADPEQTD